MYYMDDEDYFEPGEFDEKIEELKNELRESVKKEIKDELEKLRKENKKLQDIKENFESVKKDYERKKAECNRAMQNAEHKAKQARLKELMDCFKITLWSVRWDYQYKKKCDKCNFQRYVKVTLPSGKMADDDCECGIGKLVYYPQEQILYRLSDGYRQLMAWYIPRSNAEDDTFTYTKDVKVIIDHDKDFEEIDEKKLQGTFFTTKEECQEFCDYMNEKEENSGYDYDLAGKLIKAREV